MRKVHALRPPPEVAPVSDGAPSTTLGERIAEARHAYTLRTGREMKKAHLARACRVTPATVGAWESNRKVPPVDRVLVIADALGADPGWLAFPPRPAGRYRGAARAAGKAAGITPPPPAPTRRRHAPLPPMYWGTDAEAGRTLAGRLRVGRR